MTNFDENTYNFTQKTGLNSQKLNENRMWADAQHDGRPAEYRWCPLLNAAAWLTPTNSSAVQ